MRDLAGDEGLVLDLLGELDGDVELVVRVVELAVGAVQRDLHVGVLVHERGQGGDHLRFPESHRRGDIQHPLGMVAEGDHEILGRRDAAADLGAALVEGVAVVGQRHAVLGAHQQAHAHAVLQMGDLLAHGGRRLGHLPRGRRKAARFHHPGEEDDQARQVHGAFLLCRALGLPSLDTTRVAPR